VSKLKLLYRLPEALNTPLIYNSILEFRIIVTYINVKTVLHHITDSWSTSTTTTPSRDGALHSHLGKIADLFVCSVPAVANAVIATVMFLTRQVAQPSGCLSTAWPDSAWQQQPADCMQTTFWSFEL
jgi:hypothetical protein